MATFVSGYISDLSPFKNNIKLRLRILRAWLQPLYNNPIVNNMEMIVMDEHNNKMHATVRMDKLNRFNHHLKEGNSLTLKRYSLSEIKLKFRMVNNAMRLSFLSKMEVETCPDFDGSYHSFFWRPHKSITILEKEEDGQFEKQEKKPIRLLDDEGNEINCTLWGDFAQQFNDFLNTCDDHGMIVLVLQFAMMKFWDGKMCIQNGLFAKQQTEQSENTATKISTASKNSTKDNFFNKHHIRNIFELFDVEQGVPSVIVGIVITIQEDEGWWYLGCRACRGKVIKSTEYIDLESEMPKNPDGPNDWWCQKGNAWVALIKSQLSLQIRVQDKTGRMSFSLFNDEVWAMVGRSAYQLCEKYAKSELDGSIPTEITNLIGNKYAFKVAIDDFNMQQQYTNVVTTLFLFGLNRSLTLGISIVSQRPILSNNITNANRTQRFPNSTKSVAIGGRVRRTPNQSTNLATSPLSFGNSRTPTLENYNVSQTPAFYNTITTPTSSQMTPNSPASVATRGHQVTPVASTRKRKTPLKEVSNGDFDTCIEQRDIVIEKHREDLERINIFHPLYLTLQYPLLMACGQDGYHLEIPHRKKSGEPAINKKDKTKFLVDGYTMVETVHLYFHQAKHSKLRCDTYSDIRSSIAAGNTDPTVLRKPIVLSSSFIGGSRYTRQNYMDATTLCILYGCPDLFITITCNPNWSEIARYMREHNLTSTDRPDVLSRFFKIKLDQLMKDVKELRLFGRVQAAVYTVEFQKRGLLHAHICLFLHKDDKVPNVEHIDRYISAEIPDPNYDPDLYKLVSNFMMHGPCDEDDPSQASGLLEDDKEYIECIKDAVHWATTEHLCELFVTLLSQKELTIPLSVWLQTWHLLAEDVQFKRMQILKRPDLVVSDEEKKNVALFYIEELMRLRGTTLRHWPEMPYPDERYISEFERTLRDVLHRTRYDTRETPFGNMTMVFGGDFRQVLPVTPKSLRQDIVSASLKQSYLWDHCKTANMRLTIGASPEDVCEIRDFTEWILKVRDGKLGEANDGEVSIDVPEELLIDAVDDPVTSIIEFTYPNLLNNINDLSYF
nr:hypothetical protein [Tanacetum cinerariifolium]